MASPGSADAYVLAASRGDADAFGAFYEEYAESVLRYFAVRVDQPEAAADLTAETFASALLAVRTYRPRRDGAAVAWLFTIARSKLIDSLRHGVVVAEARQRLRLDAQPLDDEDLRRVEELIDAERRAPRVLELLAELPDDQRDAVVARVIGEQEYAGIAADQHCTEATARQRVSRALAALRSRLTVEGAVVAAVVVVAAVPATLASYHWRPFGDRADAPSVSRAKPALYDVLGVLRRPQTDADRGPETEYALKFVGDKTYEGAQLDYARFAPVGPGDRGVVLVPYLAHRVAPDAPAIGNTVCMWRSDWFEGKREGGAPGCFDAGAIRRGLAIKSLGHRVDMLVPDGVARVKAIADGVVDDAVPIDNVASWYGRLPQRVEWYDDRGRRVARP
jgi:RNA polymerase sigma-70 factor (ECF subfamily)